MGAAGAAQASAEKVVFGTPSSWCSTEIVRDFGGAYDTQYPLAEGTECGARLRVGSAQTTYIRGGRDADCGEQLGAQAIETSERRFDVSALGRHPEVLNATLSTHGAEFDTRVKGIHYDGLGGKYAGPSGVTVTNLMFRTVVGNVVERWLAGDVKPLELSVDDPGLESPNDTCYIASPFDHRAEVDNPGSANVVHRPKLEVEVAPKTGARPLYPMDRLQFGTKIVGSVNAATGNFVLSHESTDSGPPSAPFSIAASYNSASTVPGALGPGWTLDASPDIRLEKFPGSKEVALHDRTGVVTGLDYVGDRLAFGESDEQKRVGEFIEPSWLQADLSTTASGYELVDRVTGAKRLFGPDGRLLSEPEPSGGDRTFEYDAAGRLQTIMAAGRRLAVSYVSGRVTAIREVDAQGAVIANGVSVVWSYRPDGRMDSVQDQYGLTTYQYDGAGRLSHIGGPRGVNVDVAYATSGKVESVSYGSDDLPNQNAAYNYMNHKTVVAVAGGASRDYYYDDFDRLYAPDTAPPNLTVTAPEHPPFTTGLERLDVPFQAEDDRSGVKSVNSRTAGGVPLTAADAPNCVDANTIPGWEPISGVASVCERLFSGTLSIPPAILPEGRGALAVRATDGGGNVSADRLVPTAIDRTGPTLDVSGSVLDLRSTPVVANETRTLAVTAADGVVGGPLEAQRSGVAWIGVQVDGEFVYSASAPASALDSQGLTLNVTMPASPSVGQPGNETGDGYLDDTPPTSPVAEPVDTWVEPEVDAVGSGSGTLYLDNASHAFVIIAGDKAGNQSAFGFKTGPAVTDDED